MRISFENEDMNESTSIGRRRFNVVLHHSNKFGVVLTNDRPLYNWNFNRESRIHDYHVPSQPFHSSFEVNNRQRSFPYIYE
jgi:hypothetical protein